MGFVRNLSVFIGSIFTGSTGPEEGAKAQALLQMMTDGKISLQHIEHVEEYNRHD